MFRGFSFQSTELENINIELDENVKCLEKEKVDLTQRLSGLSSDLEAAEERNTALMEKINQFSQPDSSGSKLKFK